ncbi:MAG: beta-propeller fold lactonase family protein, partial [Nitrospina sp.]|nr:beta-propeller fold lactonase family protein [Nitrospina sp.]
MKKIVSIFCLVAFFSPVNLFAFDWKNHDLSHLVVVTNRDASELTIVDMTKDEVIGKQKIALNSQAHMTAFSPDGKKLAIAATENNLVSVMDLSSNEIKDINVGSGPEHMDISKDNRWLYVGNIEGGTVSAIDLEKNQEVARLNGFREPHGATIMASGDKVYIPNRGAQLVGVVDGSLSTRDILVGSLTGLASFDRDQAGASKHRERSIPTNGVANVTLTLDEKYAYVATGDANSVT